METIIEEYKQRLNNIENGISINKEIEMKIQISSEQLKALQDWLNVNAKFVEKIEHKEHYLDNPNDSFYFVNSEEKK